MSDHQRYPLSWPRGWKRTPPTARLRATFMQTVSKQENRSDINGVVTPRTVKTDQRVSILTATQRLERQLELLGAERLVLSTNIEIRLDGRPRSTAREPEDVGAAVYFVLEKKPVAFACDRWDRVADNIAALAQHIDALRRIERYGVGTMAQAFAGYAALQASPSDWWIVLDVSPEATTAQVDDAYRRLARKAHPDMGGSHDEMARLNAARDVARASGR